MSKTLWINIFIFLIQIACFAQNVGIGTNMPVAKLHVVGDKFLIGNNLYGSGNRWYWNNVKNSLRAGTLASPFLNYANEDSIGNASFVWGLDQRVVGSFGVFSLGTNNYVNGYYNSFALGESNVVKGDNGSFALGLNNVTMQNQSFALGAQNIVNGFMSGAIGQADTITANNAYALGINNKVQGGSGSFAIGNGNITNGSFGCVTLGIQNNSNGGSGNISMGSFNHTNGNFGSIAMGKDCVSTGGYGSVAMGYASMASNISSIAIGSGSISSGSQSYSFGMDCHTPGTSGSVSMGLLSQALGDQGALALGYGAMAKGNISYAMGRSTITKSYYETCLGIFNDTIDVFSLNQFASSPDQKLFSIGNGTGLNSRSNALVILKNGNMGIGENRPTNLLELKNQSGFTQDMQLMLHEISTGFSRIGFKNAGVLGWTLAAHREENAALSSMNFYSNQLNGDVLSLRGDGTACFYGNVKANVVTTCSDVRYKTKIKILDHALDKLNNIDGVSYYYNTKDFPNLHFPSGEQAGLIAQQVEEVLPQVVYTDPNGYKSVDYAKVVPLLVEAIKTLNHKNDKIEYLLELQNLINSSLQNRIDKLESKFEIK